MKTSLEEDARRFLATLGPRKEPELGELRSLLSGDEIEAIESVLEDCDYQALPEFRAPRGMSAGRPRKPLARVPNPLARLQLFIGLQDGTVSNQVRAAVLNEMRRRGWVWSTAERGGFAMQFALCKATGVSSAQVSRFLHGGDDGVVKTSTMDRIAQVTRLSVTTFAEHGRVHDALTGQLGAGRFPAGRGGVWPLTSRRERHDDPAGKAETAPGQGNRPTPTVTQQVRDILQGVMELRRWSQGEFATWTGVAQSQISRFIHGGEIKTAALDRIGAFLWVGIEPSENVGTDLE